MLANAALIGPAPSASQTNAHGTATEYDCQLAWRRSTATVLAFDPCYTFDNVQTKLIIGQAGMLFVTA